VIKWHAVIGCNTKSLQQIHNKSTTSLHVEMLWICCRTSICCGFVVQLVVQQIHNKSV